MLLIAEAERGGEGLKDCKERRGGDGEKPDVAVPVVVVVMVVAGVEVAGTGGGGDGV